jgi:hypothetical protein
MKYRIKYSYLKPDGTVMPNQTTPWLYSREEANNMWLTMKSQDCFANMKPESVDENEVERHIVTVAFKTYDYVVEGPVKRGQFVKVLSGENVVKLEVLKIDPPKRADINYKLAERVC